MAHQQATEATSGRRGVSAERDQRIAQLYRQGYGTPRIGRLFEVWAKDVYAALERQHVELRSRSEGVRLARALRRELGSPKWDRRVAGLYGQDYGAPEIGRLLGISKYVVYKALERQHVELRSTGEAVALARWSSLHEQVRAEAGACGSPKCTDPECPVAPGHCHRPGCPNKAATPHHTQLGQRDIKGLPRKYCSRSCAQSVRAVELPVGRCGSPGCTDGRCSVPAGQCHRPGCDRPAAVSPESIRRERWVKGFPKLYCSGACAAHAGVAGMASRHARELATLESEGLVPSVKAAHLLGRDPRFPSRLEPLLDFEHRKFDRRVRRGVNARELLPIATVPNARGILAVPLAALNGTERVGRPGKLSAAESQDIVDLRNSNPAMWTWEALAAKINVGRGERVSFMAVKRAYERETGLTKPRAA